MMTTKTLRELCEAVAGAWEAYRANRTHEAWHAADNCDHALAIALGSAEADDMEAVARSILAALDAERAAGLRDAAEWCEAWGPISSVKGDFNKGCAVTYEHAASHFRYVAGKLQSGPATGTSAPSVTVSSDDQRDEVP